MSIKTLDAAIAESIKGAKGDFKLAWLMLKSLAMGDPDILLEFCEDSYLESRAKRLIREAAQKMPERAATRDHRSFESQTRNVSRGDETRASGGGDLMVIVTPRTDVPATPQAPARAPIMAAAVVQGILDMDKINGKSLRLCSVEEVDAWRKSHKIRDRFYERLTQNLRPGAIIGEHVKDDEAEALWRAAKMENA